LSKKGRKGHSVCRGSDRSSRMEILRLLSRLMERRFVYQAFLRGVSKICGLVGEMMTISPSSLKTYSVKAPHLGKEQGYEGSLVPFRQTCGLADIGKRNKREKEGSPKKGVISLSERRESFAHLLPKGNLGGTR